MATGATVFVIHVFVSACIAALAAESDSSGFAMFGFIIGAFVGAMTSPIVIWMVREKEIDVALILLYASMGEAFLLFSVFDSSIVLLGVLLVTLIASSLFIRRIMPNKAFENDCLNCGYQGGRSEAAPCSECGLQESEQLVPRRGKWMILIALLSASPIVFRFGVMLIQFAWT